MTYRATIVRTKHKPRMRGQQVSERHSISAQGARLRRVHHGARARAGERGRLHPLVSRLRDARAGAVARKAPAVVRAHERAVRRLDAPLCTRTRPPPYDVPPPLHPFVKAQSASAPVQCACKSTKTGVLLPAMRLLAPRMRSRSAAQPARAGRGSRAGRAPDSGARRCGHWSAMARQAPPPSRQSTRRRPSSCAAVGRAGSRSATTASGYLAGCVSCVSFAARHACRHLGFSWQTQALRPYSPSSARLRRQPSYGVEELSRALNSCGGLHGLFRATERSTKPSL